ncbi:hypothetical protein BY996DRAFT_6416634 [Phakopsora pachyrhizi]|nr:hypothetical protein BY996DRAFT_6416634 [Phakopsora pachyrhizi]
MGNSIDLSTVTTTSLANSHILPVLLAVPVAIDLSPISKVSLLDGLYLVNYKVPQGPFPLLLSNYTAQDQKLSQILSGSTSRTIWWMCCFYSAARAVQRPCAPGKGPSEGPVLGPITANPVTCEADLPTNAVDKILAIIGQADVPQNVQKTPQLNARDIKILGSIFLLSRVIPNTSNLIQALDKPSSKQFGQDALLKVIGDYTLGKVIGQAFFGPKIIPGAFMFMCSD